MAQWYRVFSTAENPPDPDDLLRPLLSHFPRLKARFLGSREAWLRGEFTVQPDCPMIELERYLTEEDDLSADLQSWAAWLETCEDEPHSAALMQHVIATRQLFTILVDEPYADINEEFARTLASLLAQATNGVFQSDGLGFFAGSGELLVPESPAP
ncbi:MAG: hypothetical protein KatS3mg105_3431 [Gemmatales bacterium]|nr:MAG: hypothetical protein KatS3mg105_3431 [Gemmatales bacterium]